eukprot:CAMPEP_0172298830 /NCGR_PEP_ID=MMETSP1058-20130122/1300_1 /TAXON_ID=83371 /ORGANISM="Detonula confervacea, Strain CCMP 353" /LENGTH=598 /DNA_ID=CAMNT_0013008123 /DNA_START=69 /DNA_END=1862 /DNA_ORIENTATION=+
MHFQASAILVFAGILHCTHSLRDNLRNPAKQDQRRVQGNSQGNGNGRKVGQTQVEECAVVVAQLLAIEPGTIDDTIIECEMDSADMDGYTGIVRQINGTPEQVASLKAMWKNGQLIPGETMLKHGAGASYDEEAIHLPPGLVVANSVRQDRTRRRLQNGGLTGLKPMLAVRVIDSVGKVHPNSPAAMSDNIFGTGTDVVNLKNQLEACSFGKLEIGVGVGASQEVDGAPGMIEVTLDIELVGNSRSAILNAAKVKVQDLLGHSLPGPYEQIMFNLQGCYQDCGWAAYAYINRWDSVYQGNYYYMTGVQVHELGHNFGLAHSGGLDGATYTDHTGMMGNPLYSDETGKMCYNAAKNFQIDGWYNDAKRTLATNGGSSSFIPTELNLVGVAEYDIRGGRDVTVKLETGTSTDYFIGYNRATGPNSQNDEADNEVTVTTSGNNGVSYSQSFLKATLQQGESYTINSFGTTGQALTITATAISTAIPGPGVATVCVAYGTSSCTPTTPPPTPPPTTGQPTPPPTTASPTTPVPTPPPTTGQPTPSPTTAPPTPSPTTGAPTTAAPTKFPTPQPTNPPTDVFVCSGLWGGECKSANGGNTCVW